LADKALGSHLAGGQKSPANFQFTLESPLEEILTEEVLHDVFGWGVGAEDWQTENPLISDMLDFGNLEMNLAFDMARNASNEGAGDAITGLQRSDSQQVSWADQRVRGSTYLPNTYPGSNVQRDNENGSPGPVRQDDETAWVRILYSMSSEVSMLKCCCVSKPHVFRPINGAQLRRLALSHPITVRRTGPFGPEDHPFVKPDIVGALTRLAFVAHGTPYGSGIDVDNFPDASVLSACITLYFRHFHPLMPILRRSVFIELSKTGAHDQMGRRSQDDPQHVLLILTVSAIGATYGSADWKPLSSFLHELGRRVGKYLVR
jgi:hypothetical protein